MLKKAPSVVYPAVCLLCTLIPNLVFASPFGMKVDYDVGEQPTDVVSAYLGSDGNLDLAVTSASLSQFSQLTVFSGDGTGIFSPLSGADSMNYPYAITTADVNGDGGQQLLMGNNSGLGLLPFSTNKYSYYGSARQFATAGQVNAVDAEGDRVVVANANNASIGVFYNTWDQGPANPNLRREFGDPTVINVSGNPVDVKFAPLPFDIVVANTGSSVQVIFANGDTENFNITGTQKALAVGDINNDGYPDVAVVTQQHGTALLLSNSDGSYASTNYGQVLPRINVSGEDLALTDLNGDGNLDLVTVTGYTPGYLKSMYGNGDGSFTDLASVNVGNYPVSLAMGDFNNDGKPDAAVVNNQSDSVSVLLNVLSNDVTAPQGDFNINDGAQLTNNAVMSIDSNCMDAVVANAYTSSCKYIELSSDGNHFTQFEAIGSAFAWDSGLNTEGIATIYARFIDAAGNVSSITTRSISLDTVPPPAPEIVTPVDNEARNDNAFIMSGSSEAGSTIHISIAGNPQSATTGVDGSWQSSSITLDDGQHTINVSAVDEAGNISTAASVSILIDREAPSVTLIGDEQFAQEAGVSFTDPGATAMDSVDGNLSEQIIITGTIDVGVPGVYELTYTVSDSVGNMSESVVREVVVTDTQPPETTLTGPAAVIINIGETYDDPGATAVDSFEGDLTSTIRVAGAIDSNRAGVYTINYHAADSSGNKSNTVQRSITVQAEPDTQPSEQASTSEQGASIVEGEGLDGDTSETAFVTETNTSTPGAVVVEETTILEGESGPDTSVPTNPTMSQSEALLAEIQSSQIDQVDSPELVESLPVGIPTEEIETREPELVAASLNTEITEGAGGALGWWTLLLLTFVLPRRFRD